MLVISIKKVRKYFFNYTKPRNFAIKQMVMKLVKPKKCAVCGEEFTPFRSTQKVCGTACAISLGKSNIQKKNAKAWRKENSKKNLWMELEKSNKQK